MVVKKRVVYVVAAVVALVLITAVGMNLQAWLPFGQEKEETAQPINFQREQVLSVMAQGIESWIATSTEELREVAEATSMPMPLIDFEQAFAIAVGVNQTNEGKTLRIEHVEQKGDQVTVKVTMLTPAVDQAAQGSDVITVLKQDLEPSGVLTFNFVDQAGRELGHRQALVK